MKKRNLLRTTLLSAGISVMVAANALPCTVFAEELTSTTNTEATADESSAAGQSAETGDSTGRGDSTQSGDSTGSRGGKVSTSTSVQTVEEYDYDITVTFTKNRGVLTDISVTSDTSNKNNKYTSNALAQITEKLKSGSEADVVSGATYSSNAIIAAIKDAGDYDSVSADLTSSLNGEAPTASQGQSGKGQSSEGQSGEGQSGEGQSTAVTVPANYITYTVSSNADNHKVVAFELSSDAAKDNTYVNMVLLVDDNGKHFMPVDADSDETGNANDYFAYQAENTSFTILNDELASIEVIFTSDVYGKVHFTVDLTAVSGGNEEGSGAKEDDPKGNEESSSAEESSQESSSAEESKPAESEQGTSVEESTAAETSEQAPAESVEEGTADTEETTAAIAESKEAEQTTAAIAESEDAEQTTAAATDSVNTGDNAPVFLFSALAVMSVIGLAVLCRRRKLM